MLLCGAFMEDEPPRRAPPPPKPPPPEPDDRDLAKPPVDPVRYLELWIAQHGGASEEVLRDPWWLRAKAKRKTARDARRKNRAHKNR